MWSVLTQRRGCAPKGASEIFLTRNLSKPGADLCCSHHLSPLPGLLPQLKLLGLHSGNPPFESMWPPACLQHRRSPKGWAEERRKEAGLGFRQTQGSRFGSFFGDH